MHYIGILIGGNENYLEEYYEGLEVESYVVASKEEIIQEYINNRKNIISWKKQKIKENDSRSSEYQEWINTHPKLTKRSAWSQIKKDYEGYIDEYGNILSTCNPNAKWDWYVIGGRWSGYFPLKEKDENNEIIWTDSATISEIDWEEYKQTRKSPYCYITVEGEWCSRGDIGWFSSTNNKSEELWGKEFFNELKNNDPDTVITAIDFHI